MLLMIQVIIPIFWQVNIKEDMRMEVQCEFKCFWCEHLQIVHYEIHGIIDEDYFYKCKKYNIEAGEYEEFLELLEI